MKLTFDPMLAKDNSGFFDLIPLEHQFEKQRMPLVIRRAIPAEVCRYTIRANESNKTRTTPAPTGPGGVSQVSDYRNSESIIDPSIKSVMKIFNPIALQDAINKHWGVNFTYGHIPEFDPAILTKFSTGQYCRTHKDVIWGDGMKLLRPTRRISALAYLTGWHYKEKPEAKQLFTGGELVFPSLIDEIGNRFVVQPGEGDIILFPSNPRYMHCVPKVTSGVRYTLVSFYEITGNAA